MPGSIAYYSSACLQIFAIVKAHHAASQGSNPPIAP